MKRMWILLAACLLAVSVAACGSDAEETPAQAEPEETAVTEEAPEEKEEPDNLLEKEAEVQEPENPAEEVEPETPAGPTVEDALACVDQDVAALYEAIGAPLSSSYEASCMGDGDDGILEYDGFIVFTYREKDGSAETVIDAE